MRRIILTAIGSDRAGLVAELADLVTFHGGNWEHSELAELAGTFAGVVQVAVPDGRLEALVADLDQLEGDLDVQARLVDEPAPNTPTLRIDLLADDRPGIVNEISRTLADLGVSISRLDTETKPTPMAGGQLFSLSALLSTPAGLSADAVGEALERISHELMVDLSLSDADAATEPPAPSSPGTPDLG